MGNYSRKELEEMVRRWTDANAKAEEIGDWKGLADFYTEDAHYSWNNGPGDDFHARNLQEIRDWAVGLEMVGFEDWKYPFKKVIIDKEKGEVVIFWDQISPYTKEDGSEYKVEGKGGSWLKYAGNYKWSEQFDFYDFGNVMALITELMEKDLITSNKAFMDRTQKIINGEIPPGHVISGKGKAK